MDSLHHGIESCWALCQICLEHVFPILHFGIDALTLPYFAFKITQDLYLKLEVTVQELQSVNLLMPMPLLNMHGQGTLD